MRNYNSNKMLGGIIDLKKLSSALSLFVHSQLPIMYITDFSDEHDVSRH